MLRPTALAFALVLTPALLACPKEPAQALPSGAGPEAASKTAPAAPASAPASQPAAAGKVRADAARARLAKTDAGKKLLASIEHHGGLERWYSQNALAFRYAYRPEGDRPARDSLQHIQLATSRAYHQLFEPAVGRFAWDGERAWMKLADETARFGARFWALTPYYFVGMPFVLADPGVQLAVISDAPAAAGFEAAHVIKATFATGVGDAPDDYYVLYLDPQDGHLLGLRYVVSYFKEKGPDGKRGHGAEKLIVYSDWQTTDGLKIARLHETFAFADGKKGERFTVSKVSDLQIDAPFDEAKLTMPAGAVVDTSLN